MGDPSSRFSVLKIAAPTRWVKGQENPSLRGALCACPGIDPPFPPRSLAPLSRLSFACSRAVGRLSGASLVRTGPPFRTPDGPEPATLRSLGIPKIPKISKREKARPSQVDRGDSLGPLFPPPLLGIVVLVSIDASRSPQSAQKVTL